MDILSVKDLSVDLGEFSLRKVSFGVPEGSYCCLLGASGAGKSILLETIMGGFSPKHGKVFLRGEDVTNLPPEKRKLGIVYQDYMLFPHLDVFNNIAFGLKEKSLKKTEIHESVLDISKNLHIDGLLHRNISTLSGGEQQRVALARALITKPEILLMDEAFSALDLSSREKMRQLVRSTVRDLGITVLHVTHDSEDVWALADKVAVIHDGALLQSGTPDEVFQCPRPGYVAGLVGARNILAGTITESDHICNSTIKCKGEYFYSAGSKYMEKDQEILFSVRPEDIMVAREPMAVSSRNQMEMNIEGVEKRGPLVWLSGRKGELELHAVVTASSYEELELDINTNVVFIFKARAVQILEQDTSGIPMKAGIPDYVT